MPARGDLSSQCDHPQDISAVDPSTTFFIFLSHCWIAGKIELLCAASFPPFSTPLCMPDIRHTFCHSSTTIPPPPPSCNTSPTPHASGYNGSPHWRGRPHPDNLRNEKHELAVQGAETAWKTLAPLMQHCYLWVDFSCIDQDDNPAGELQALDRIVQVGGGARTQCASVGLVTG